MRTEARAELAPPHHRTVPLSRYPVFAGLAAAALAWDLYSKSSVFGALGVGGISDWQKFYFGNAVRFRLHTNFNYGALWGFGQGYTFVFATLSLVAATGILYWLFLRGGARSWWLTVALGLILGGTLGNLYDRLGLHGWKNADGPVYAVRDFLDFQFFGVFDWAIFNFADSYLVTGAIMLVLYSFKPEPHAVAQSAESGERNAETPTAC